MSWPWLAIIEVLWVAGAALWILSDRRAPAATIAWMAVLAFLEATGGVGRR